MSRPASRPLGVFLAALSALLLFAAGEPAGLGLVAWVALVPLAVAVFRERSAGWTALLALIFGLVYFGIHLSWIFLFGWMAWSALTLFMALYITAGVFVGSVAARLASSGRILAPLFFAGAWTGAELLRDRWPFGGYPWGAVGTTQGSVPGVRWLAGVIGVYGLSFLIVLFSALIAWGLVHKRFAWTSVIYATFVVSVFVGIDLIGYGTPSQAKPLRVGVIQGSVPRPLVFGQNHVVLRNHLNLTKKLLEEEGPVDVVVWPESSVANRAMTSGLESVRDLADETGTPFLVGRSFFTTESYFNRVEEVTAEGTLDGRYLKRHPVPFGEYVPLGFLRNAVGTLQSQIPVDQVRGTKATVFDVDGSKIAPPICFESVFPRDFLDYVRNGAELFVIFTNNTSFERSYAAQQHIAHARMRALETRQWVVQAALAGISGVMGPDGSISEATDLFKPEAFVAEVGVRPAQSLYAKTGDLFPSLWAGGSGAAFLFALLRLRSAPVWRRKTEGPLES
jgi:apolipoprotein N-acyltransferase